MLEPPQHRELRIRQVVAMIQELHDLIVEINQVYALSLGTAMAHDLAISTSELYILFGQSVGMGGGYQTDDDYRNQEMRQKLLGYVALCMIPPLYKLIIAPFYCDRAVTEAKKCLRLVEQLDIWFPRSTSLRHLVESQMCWRRQAKTQFTGGLDVVLNRRVISMVRLLQFQISNN